ncbi:hypothetical protein F5Y14DRAFT_441512 [Nemania sp. NC0429]|nr:hypothetical protein F5Y14DRAFT_441512 [Nemania sp. NC0429]
MRRAPFPLNHLPAWCMLNNVRFDGVAVAETDGRGLGVIAEKHLTNEDNELPALLTIPKHLVLCPESVDEYAKESKDFRDLLDAAGRQSPRGDVLLFLLAQLVLSSPDYNGGLGPGTAWTQYFKLLPAHVPTPTSWSESELSLLRGTSLEPAVSAKRRTLEREFNGIQDATTNLPRWNELIGVDGAIALDDWILLDALYRSRSLALPRSGESMVPCLDLVNHSNTATAYFEESSNDDVVLLLHRGATVPEQGELTINYGHDKSAAEMLFSYGFIESHSPAKSIILPVEAMDDDPLAKAKLYAFGSPPTLKITDSENGAPQWNAPFIYLACLNDEDGLHFKVLQETDGSQSLKMFWQDMDVTDQADNMQTLIEGHDLCQIFRLRAVSVVLGMIQQQLAVLVSYDKNSELIENERPHIRQAAMQLRAAEEDLFTRILQVLEDEKSQLLEDESVATYLATVNGNQQDDLDDEDFS